MEASEQPGFFNVACRHESPKVHILSEGELGGSQTTFYDCLAWKSHNINSPTLLVEADTKAHLM